MKCVAIRNPDATVDTAPVSFNDFCPDLCPVLYQWVIPTPETFVWAVFPLPWCKEVMAARYNAVDAVRWGEFVPLFIIAGWIIAYSSHSCILVCGWRSGRLSWYSQLPWQRSELQHLTRYFLQSPQLSEAHSSFDSGIQRIQLEVPRTRPNWRSVGPDW